MSNKNKQTLTDLVGYYMRNSPIATFNLICCMASELEPDKQSIFCLISAYLTITLSTINVAREVTRRVAPSFRVRVWFRAILRCLILKMGFSSLLIYS